MLFNKNYISNLNQKTVIVEQRYPKVRTLNNQRNRKIKLGIVHKFSVQDTHQNWLGGSPFDLKKRSIRRCCIIRMPHIALLI